MAFKKTLLATVVALLLAGATSSCQSTGDTRSVPTDTGTGGGSSY